MDDITPKISEAELQLLQILWDESPLGAADLASRVPDNRGWQLQTVKTLLSRLAAKGAVVTRKDGRRYLYEPAVDREVIAARQADSLLERLFGGRISPLVAQLAEQRKFDADDLAELEALIRSLKK